jgi:hypothetical protein
VRSSEGSYNVDVVRIHSSWARAALDRRLTPMRTDRGCTILRCFRGRAHALDRRFVVCNERITIRHSQLKLAETGASAGFVIGDYRLPASGCHAASSKIVCSRNRVASLSRRTSASSMAARTRLIRLEPTQHAASYATEREERNTVIRTQERGRFGLLACCAGSVFLK